MGRRNKPGRPPSARTRGRALGAPVRAARPPAIPRLTSANRHALLLGTALASTLLIATVSVPTPAAALVTCAGDVGTGPAPIDRDGVNDDIRCVNNEDRDGTIASPDAIRLTGSSVAGQGGYIYLNSQGVLTPYAGGKGIIAYTYNGAQRVDIKNSGDINATTRGIVAFTQGSNSPLIITNYGAIAGPNAYGGIFGAARGSDSDLTITNHGDIALGSGIGISANTYAARSDIVVTNSGAVSGGRFGILTRTFAGNSTTTIGNTGNIQANSDPAGGNFDAYGIQALAGAANSGITITNGGQIAVSAPGAAGDAYGIDAFAVGPFSPISITNTATMSVVAGNDAYGIRTFTYAANSNIAITNSGALAVRSQQDDAYGIDAYTYGTNSSVTIANTAVLNVTGADNAYGVRTATGYHNSSIRITNSGPLSVLGMQDDAYGLYAYTYGNASPITITNNASLTVTSQQDDAYGIDAYSYGANSRVTVVNTGAMTVTAAEYAYGIRAATGYHNSAVRITNSGALTVTGTTEDALGIYAYSYGRNSAVSVVNRGRLTVASTQENAYGIYAGTGGAGSSVFVNNSAAINVSARNGETEGIYSETDSANSKITIVNTGDVTSSAGTTGDAIDAESDGDRSPVDIYNSGTLVVTARMDNASGIESDTEGTSSGIAITNAGAVSVTSGQANAFGLSAETSGDASGISLTNRGRVDTSGSLSYGLWAQTTGRNAAIGVDNAGTVTANSRGGIAAGLKAVSNGDAGSISITNRGDVAANSLGLLGGIAYGLLASTYGRGGTVSVQNAGSVEATGYNVTTAVNAKTAGAGSGISIVNRGSISSETVSPLGFFSAGIFASTAGTNSAIDIVNSGSVYASGGSFSAAISTTTSGAGSNTRITNTGDLSSQSGLAIYAQGSGRASVYNAGTITGYVTLTEQNDLFVNQAGGLFEATKTSTFGRGRDLFDNLSGATVLAATDASVRETSSFMGLETFRNAGLISLQDGGIGDRFTIANTRGGKNLDFMGGGRLAVDASLGGPGSQGDLFVVDGNVSGRTTVVVNDTNPGPGTFNSQGIRVVSVTGKTPRGDSFVLEGGPINKGLFDYDLFFTPTGSGYWGLKSFVNGQGHVLPGLLTAAQDIWHETSSTWFDRTADLRVVLNGGGSPSFDAGTASSGDAGTNGLTPGAWIKGGGSWLGRDGSAKTSAFGRNYTYDLDNELRTIDLQVGFDMGRYDVLSDGDALVVGFLGGFVGGSLDYNALASYFDFSGGQVGAYATYLNGGLFVDTLLNVHLYEIDTPNLGFPDSLDGTTVGLRTDAGYRLGSFTGGAFLEPLATIEVAWADIDGFSRGGNAVSFADDANVRGRLGARAGTTMQAWEGTTMEPFLIASLWGNLTGDNSATLVSSGRSFQLQDDLQDVWGEISAGVNLFNFAETTAVFAKVDYTFGEDLQGVGGKAGMRVSW